MEFSNISYWNSTKNILSVTVVLIKVFSFVP